LFDRRFLREKKENDYIREKWLDHLAHAQLDTFTINNRDSINAPLIVKVRFSATEQAQMTQDLVYFNPMLLGRHKQNPLKLAERTLFLFANRALRRMSMRDCANFTTGLWPHTPSRLCSKILSRNDHFLALK